MRMWMVSPQTMCNKHLFGEHVECHMLVGAIARKKSISGYIQNNLLEPASISSRHNELAAEIERRGYMHNSPLSQPDISHLPKHEQSATVNLLQSYLDLHDRCVACRNGEKLI